LRDPFSPCSVTSGNSEEATGAPPSELVSEFKRIEDINANIRKIVRSESGSPTSLAATPTPEIEDSLGFEIQPVVHKAVSRELSEWLQSIRLGHLAGVLGDAGYD
jgi:hypothetical protein